MRRIGRVACSECRNSPSSSSPPLQRPSVTHVSLLTRSAHTSLSAGHSATLLKKPRHNGSVVRWVGLGDWERDWARARDLLEQSTCQYCQWVTIERRTDERMRRRKQPKMVRKGGGPARPSAGGREGDRQGRPINSVSVSDFMGSFSQRKKQRERQVQCRQASGASKRAGRKYVCEAIMQIVRARPRNFSNGGTDG